MSYIRYYKEEKYIGGEPTGEYRASSTRYDEKEYPTICDCDITGCPIIPEFKSIETSKSIEDVQTLGSYNSKLIVYDENKQLWYYLLNSDEDGSSLMVNAYTGEMVKKGRASWSQNLSPRYFITQNGWLRCMSTLSGENFKYYDGGTLYTERFSQKIADDHNDTVTNGIFISDHEALFVVSNTYGGFLKRDIKKVVLHDMSTHNTKVIFETDDKFFTRATFHFMFDTIAFTKYEGEFLSVSEFNYRTLEYENKFFAEIKYPNNFNIDDVNRDLNVAKIKCIGETPSFYFSPQIQIIYDFDSDGTVLEASKFYQYSNEYYYGTTFGVRFAYGNNTAIEKGEVTLTVNHDNFIPTT